MRTRSLLGLLALGCAATAAATTGTMNLTSDTTLAEDHHGDIILAADDITLDCAGYSVVGAGSGFGVSVDRRTGVVIVNCLVTGFDTGVLLDGVSGGRIEGTTSTGNAVHGFLLETSSDNVLVDNHAIDNGTDHLESGFRLYDSHRNLVEDSSASGGHRGFLLDFSDENVLRACVASDNVSTATTGGRGFSLGGGSDNLIEESTASGNAAAGFAIGNGSLRTTLRGSTATANARGIRIFRSNDNVVTDNRTESNISNSIRLDTNTGENPTGNLIYHNNFIEGTAFDGSPTDNDWHHPVLLEGNHWGNYAGTDDGSGSGKHAIAGDGIGDTLIPHPLADFDNYPFTSPDGWNDTDNDGLTDADEALIGTDPNDPDTDDDGLFDGTEVDTAQGSGCPDPLNPDSDGDTLLEGEEIATGTDPCNADSDADGLRDDVDPLPLIPGVPPGFLEGELRDLCADVKALDLALFNGPNDNANAGRRNALANHACNAANRVAEDQLASARALLTNLYDRIDSADPPADWLYESQEKSVLANRVLWLLSLIDQQLG